MESLYYDVRVDMQKDTVVDSGLRFTQGDSNLIYLRISVMNGGVIYDSENAQPYVCFVKPDGTYVEGVPSKTDSFWIYQFLGNELQSIGKVLCDVKFEFASGRISSSKFTFIVEKDTTVSYAQGSSSYIAPMQQVLDEMNGLKTQGQAIVAAAESWATGGTGTRANEDTDNARYYKEEAEKARDDAEFSKDWVENAFNEKLPLITMDFENGVLMYVGGMVVFDINPTTGMLEWYM